MQWFCLGFPMGRDGASFWDKGTEVPSLSGDKGTMGQWDKLKILPRDGTGRDSLSKSGTVRDFDTCPIPSRPAGQTGTEQKRMF